MAHSTRPNLRRALVQWWQEHRACFGFAAAAGQLLRLLWEFLRESTPERRRQRYGDMDYDWEHRVNTTSATVGWRERLLGAFLSPYQPTEPALFHEMLGSLNIDFREFVFVDLGSGKGRTLLMASEYPFRRIVGVELLPELHAAAAENLRAYRSERQQCFAIEAVLGDARRFEFPPEPTVLYLFNPLPAQGLARVIERLDQSLRESPRALYVLYHNPLLETLLATSCCLNKVGATHQYAIYGSRAAGEESSRGGQEKTAS